MPLHLIKLCVGVESVAELQYWQQKRIRDYERGAARRGPQRGHAGASPQAPRPPWHATRMTPQRRGELLNGGSLYWVIQGWVSVRQRLCDIRPFVDKDGIGRCHLVLGRTLVPVLPVPRRPFQGWRYLAAADAPPDCAAGDVADVSTPMGEELSRLGL